MSLDPRYNELPELFALALPATSPESVGDGTTQVWAYAPPGFDDVVAALATMHGSMAEAEHRLRCALRGLCASLPTIDLNARPILVARPSHVRPLAVRRDARTTSAAPGAVVHSLVS